MGLAQDVLCRHRGSQAHGTEAAPALWQEKAHTDPTGYKQVTKPTQQQAHQGKKTALQAVARNSDRELGSGPEPLDMEDSSDEDSVVCVMEGLPHMTPQISDNIA
ncbi:hypothetical protein NDU88_007424 [Pleurodeles waltl]|uniref:Uncharacterized protein n=1 Tax=Pleurodeles waltl TaxID=8319 RepID=A0AAV7RQ99_PLEWA|nr:hypothetical protein NDU88_007416 [Pleurodeles waltl]KAJ1154681.1 hypothetical protein NDU88_007424 [Pleurodeles waltl]